MQLDCILYLFDALFYVGERHSMEFFSSSRGLRQGDSLSPLLLFIVMEVLSKMISAIVNGDLLSSFSVGSRSGGAFSISHLLFADNTLIFCEPNPDHLRSNLRCLFLCFEAFKV